MAPRRSQRHLVQVLTYYELDLGLNHVVRKSNDVIDPGANMLIAVPGVHRGLAVHSAARHDRSAGAKDGPGGVLVCCENKIMYKKPGNDDVLLLLRCATAALLPLHCCR